MAGDSHIDAGTTLRFSVDHLFEGVQIIDFEWRYRYLNEAAARHGGRSPGDLLGRTMQECYPGIEATPLFETLGRVMRARERETMTNEFALPDGTRRWFELVIEPVPEGICVLSLDITERRIVEAQFQQSQKMEAVGHLAGGIAHDFNNLLTGILGYCELLLDETPYDDPRRTDLAEIRRAAMSASSLTAGLLAFSRKQVIEPMVLDLNATLTALARFLERLVGEDIEIALRLEPDLGTVRADPVQIEQLLINLAVNARDAMPKGGRLTIEAANVDLDEHYARTHFAVVPGPYVMLAVSDTGVGMTEEVQARLFEPFFTTKEPGKGTGLGLASVYGIVKQNRGNIWVYSEPGRGTTFKVYWPQLAVAQPDEKQRAAQVTHPAGSRTILLVEDNDALRALVQRVLSRQGHTVLVASSSDEAVELARVNDGVDLLLTDIVMPGMSGPELARLIQSSRPQVKVLFMSGFTDEAVIRHGLEAGAAFLQKPFTPAQIAGKVAAVMRDAHQ